MSDKASAFDKASKWPCATHTEYVAYCAFCQRVIAYADSVTADLRTQLTAANEEIAALELEVEQATYVDWNPGDGEVRDPETWKQRAEATEAALVRVERETLLRVATSLDERATFTETQPSRPSASDIAVDLRRAANVFRALAPKDVLPKKEK